MFSGCRPLRSPVTAQHVTPVVFLTAIHQIHCHMSPKGSSSIVGPFKPGLLLLLHHHWLSCHCCHLDACWQQSRWWGRNASPTIDIKSSRTVKLSVVLPLYHVCLSNRACARYLQWNYSLRLPGVCCTCHRVCCCTCNRVWSCSSWICWYCLPRVRWHCCMMLSGVRDLWLSRVRSSCCIGWIGKVLGLGSVGWGCTLLC